jgi:hypothetical protein
MLEYQMYELKDDNDSYGILLTNAEYSVVEKKIKWLQQNCPEYNTDDLADLLYKDGYYALVDYPQGMDF